MQKFKRTLCILLTCCLLLGVLPMSALAVSDNGDNDSAGTAQKVSLGDTISGQIAPQDDVDFYCFTISESGRITLDITSYMQFYTLCLYDTAGTELWYTDWNEYNATVGFREDVYTLDLESGVYYLKVTGYRNGTYCASTGNYTIQTAFAPANANESEPNNSAAEANPVTLGDTVRGLIGTNDLYDFYQFTCSESGRITLDITSYMQYYTLCLYDTAGTELWYTDWNEYNATVGFREDVYTIDLESGVYFLKVTGYRNGTYCASTGTYTIQTAFAPANANESEPNNSAAEANSVTLGSTIRGLIGVNDSYDFYQFTMPQGVQLELNITSYMQYYTLCIYDTTGEELWYTDWSECNPTTRYREDTYTIDLPSGIYYLRVTGYRNGTYGASTGTYKFSLVKKSATVPVTGIELSASSKTLKIGDSFALTASITPTDATNNAVVWSSSDASVATVNSSGRVTAVKAGTATITATTEDGGFTAKCKITVESEPTQPKINFKDVSATAYYYSSVTWAVNMGITSGTSSTTFSPDASCTRAQAVTFLWRAAGSPRPKSTRNRFTDVKPGTYYYSAVTWAVEQGITSGTSSTKFSPDDVCSRAQIVTFLYRANGSPSVNGRTFSDVPANAYYASAVKWAVARGITSGTSSKTFSPNEDCTRAQIVTFLYRAEN